MTWRSHRLGLALNSFEHKYVPYTVLLPMTYGTVVGRCQRFQGIVVTVVEFDDQRLYHHRKEHRLALLLVPHFLSIACVFGDTATLLLLCYVFLWSMVVESNYSL